jgi:hypothetical protein
MARPLVIDEPRKEIAIALSRAGMTGRWIAAYMGCDESTLRYALEKDENFRLRYMQARAQMQMDQLANIARAAAKSWRASVWLLERLFPKEYNLRKSANEPQLDELGFTIESDAHKPEAPAKDEPTTDSCPPTTDLPSLDPAALCQTIAKCGLAPSEPFWEMYNNPPAPMLDLWSGPPPISPKPYSAIREKIINENLGVDEKFKLVRDHEAKEQYRWQMAQTYGVPVEEVPDIAPPS